MIKIKSLKISILDAISIFVSFLAIIVSIRACNISEQALLYQQNRDAFLDTPSLKEVSDSTYVYFGLNNDKAELQSLKITFPDNIIPESVIRHTKPLTIYKKIIEYPISKYLEPVFKDINLNDSTMLSGYIQIPVMIDYNAIVNSDSFTLREYRCFRYYLFVIDDILTVEYSHSSLVRRCGFPLKTHTFWWGQTDSLEEKIMLQDQKDVQELLQNQLSKAIEDIRRKYM